MLKTKTPKATVGGLSPTKEYTLQVYVLNGSQEALFAKRKFVSKYKELHFTIQKAPEALADAAPKSSSSSVGYAAMTEPVTVLLGRLVKAQEVKDGL